MSLHRELVIKLERHGFTKLHETTLIQLKKHQKEQLIELLNTAQFKQVEELLVKWHICGFKDAITYQQKEKIFDLRADMSDSQFNRVLDTLGISHNWKRISRDRAQGLITALIHELEPRATEKQATYLLALERQHGEVIPDEAAYLAEILVLSRKVVSKMIADKVGTKPAVIEAHSTELANSLAGSLANLQRKLRR